LNIAEVAGPSWYPDIAVPATVETYKVDVSVKFTNRTTFPFQSATRAEFCEMTAIPEGPLKLADAPTPSIDAL
jgi:hypothetical protein